MPKNIIIIIIIIIVIIIIIIIIIIITDAFLLRALGIMAHMHMHMFSVLLTTYSTLCGSLGFFVLFPVIACLSV